MKLEGPTVDRPARSPRERPRPDEAAREGFSTALATVIAHRSTPLSRVPTVRPRPSERSVAETEAPPEGDAGAEAASMGIYSDLAARREADPTAEVTAMDHERGAERASDGRAEAETTRRLDARAAASATDGAAGAAPAPTGSGAVGDAAVAPGAPVPGASTAVTDGLPDEHGTGAAATPAARVRGGVATPSDEPSPEASDEASPALTGPAETAPTDADGEDAARGDSNPAAPQTPTRASDDAASEASPLEKPAHEKAALEKTALKKTALEKSAAESATSEAASEKTASETAATASDVAEPPARADAEGAPRLEALPTEALPTEALRVDAAGRSPTEPRDVEAAPVAPPIAPEDAELPEGVKWSLLRDAAGQRRARVTVEHPTLGTLRLDFAMLDDGIDVRVLAPSLLSALRLESDEERIRELLEERGARLAALRVNVERDAPPPRAARPLPRRATPGRISTEA